MTARIPGERDTSSSVSNPATGEVVATIPVPSVDEVQRAVESAVAAHRTLAGLDAATRAEALRTVAGRLRDGIEEYAREITTNTGKPIKWSRIEVGRTASILEIAAEEAVRFNPAAERLDGHPSGSRRLALSRRAPRGPVLAITPFNFPLHLVAHKVAPALAIGAPVLVKPAPQAPGPALLLARLVRETGLLPEGAISVLPVADDTSSALVADPRLPVVSFTGSDAVGWNIVDAVPRKQVIAELGGNAAAVIAPDYTGTAKLEYAADRIALFANYHGGQACTSPQRVLVPRADFQRFVDVLVARTEQQVVGDPFDDDTDVGPLIDRTSVARVAEWVDEATAAGATVHIGGKPDGAYYPPTVLSGVPSGSRILDEEVFGPVVSVLAYDSVDEALEIVADSRFGLAAGIFTADMSLAFRAFDELPVGSVVIGDAPTYRSDYAPFGGLRDSGQGREGLRSAMTDYSVERTLVLTDVPL